MCRSTIALAKRSPEIRQASAVRVDDMVGSRGITSYWMFSAVKYRCSVGAMDMMDLRCGLRASYHLLLPFTAPGEERSREIRRIAVTYRRAGLLLWGIRVGLHQPPVKMPGS